MEIVRIHCEAYARIGHLVALAVSYFDSITRTGKIERMEGMLKSRLEGLLGECRTAGLDLTGRQIERTLIALSQSDGLQPNTLRECFMELYGRLEDELETKWFFHLSSARQGYFDEPRKGWEDVLPQFPEAVSDVEEMRRCFALSRYPGCVFHSMQVIEHGLIRLGAVLRVKDPKSGWVATTNELKRILKKTYPSRTDWERRNFSFVEQMNATTEALMTAWRHRIDHASGRLSLLPGDFAPDIAEDIMSATRSFMRRLATEIPMEIRPETDVP